MNCLINSIFVPEMSVMQLRIGHKTCQYYASENLHYSILTIKSTEGEM